MAKEFKKVLQTYLDSLIHFGVFWQGCLQVFGEVLVKMQTNSSIISDNEMNFILINFGNDKFLKIRTALRFYDSAKKRIKFERTQDSAGNELLKVLDKMVIEAEKVE